MESSLDLALAAHANHVHTHALEWQPDVVYVVRIEAGGDSVTHVRPFDVEYFRSSFAELYEPQHIEEAIKQAATADMDVVIVLDERVEKAMFFNVSHVSDPSHTTVVDMSSVAKA